MANEGEHALEERAAALLRRQSEGDQALASEFDALLYPVVLGYVKQRNRSLGETIARRTGGVNPAPIVEAQDLDEVAHETTLLALRRARASAGRFDATLGSAVSWVLRAAAFAYLEVARKYARDRRLAPLPDVDEGASEEGLRDESIPDTYRIKRWLQLISSTA